MLDRCFRRLLADFRQQIAETPELEQYVSGMNEAIAGDINDVGGYGADDERPDFVKEAHCWDWMER